MWLIVSWAALAIAIGVIAQRGLGRTGLPWALAAFALENAIGWAVMKEPPPGLSETAYEVGAFIVIGGITFVLMLGALFTLPKPAGPRAR